VDNLSEKKGGDKQMARMSEKVSVLDSNAQLVNDDLQNIHNTVVPNLEEKISDEKKERLKLEIWGRKWNLVISGDNCIMNILQVIIDKLCI
jgi:hypothetical protein